MSAKDIFHDLVKQTLENQQRIITDDPLKFEFGNVWEGFHRVYRCVIHFDIKDGKIWLQQNLTEYNPADELIAMGVPKEDIILGLHSPFKRQYSGYGIA